MTNLEMISCSHWGLIEVGCDNVTWPDPQPGVHEGFEPEIVSAGEYWDRKLKERFPNGVVPLETPFMRRMSRK